ncbi:MAG TPA: glutaredoxin domain-containing protein [Bacillales bacterium]|nr:glutaredoxin domain-containing protein [Bacillales bacterium]
MGQQPRVIVYTQPSCPPCTIVKRFLNDHHVAFETKDVSQDAKAREELIHRYDSMSTPTVVIGDEVIVGFDQERMTRLLNLE